MKRPIFIIVLGYVIGIIIGLYLKFSIALFVFPICIVIIILEKKLISKNIKRYISFLLNKKTIILLIISIVISNTIVLLLNSSFENKYKNIEKENFVATVVSLPNKKKYYIQYKIKVETINKDKSYSNTYLFLNIKANSNLKYGDKISFTGEYIKPEVRRNYKGFDYSKYLKSIGIYGTVKTNQVEIVGNNKSNIIAYISQNIALKIKQRVEDNIKDEDKQNLLLGILLGYDEGLSNEIKQDFRNSSLSHLLAVSGMHVSYVILGITAILNIIKLPKKWIKIVIIILLIFLIFITGETASVKRACIMGIFNLLASICYRKSDIITNLSISLLIILINNPFEIMNIGLILSFFATCGILILYPIFINKTIKSKKTDSPIKKFITKINEIIALSLSAQIFILPITIVFFNKISLTFIFSNILVSIIIGAIIILGLICAVIPIKPITLALNILLEILIYISNIFSKIPLSRITIVTPNLVQIVLYYIILIFTLYIYKIRKSSFKRKYEKKILIYVQRVWNKKIKILLILSIIAIILNVISVINRQLEIHFIDVGQGDSTLIITPNRKTILIDGGGSENDEDFNVGENTLVPYLLDRKINKINYIIISHFDSDHVKGLLTVMEQLKVETVLISTQGEISDNYIKFQAIVKKKKIKVITVGKGDKVRIEKDIYFDIIWPNKSNLISENILNNNSIVCKLSYKNFSCIFTGDIEEIAEQEILKSYQKNLQILNSTVLKIAHHGSKTSSTKKFIETIKPKIALIGVGKNNIFGHPNEEILERLESLRCKNI